MDKLDQHIEKYSIYSELFIRLSVGFHLIYGTQDNVFSWERMMEFSIFLSNFGFPFPTVSAIISVYAQFICGIMYIIGFQVRLAALVMIVNFIIALSVVHLGNDTYPGAFPAIMMLAGSLFLLLNGSKVFNLKNMLKKNRV